MNIFQLPDLGEGLPDAEIHEWFVKVGDHVELDAPLVAMETAKAVVEVPSPQSGIISELFGQKGDVIKTGAPLVRFESAATATKDKGTVVGQLQESGAAPEPTCIVGGASSSHVRVQATPSVRRLAKQKKVDLTGLTGTGQHGIITVQDVEQAASLSVSPEGYEPLKGTRRAMLKSMTLSHQHVVPVTLYDEVDIHAWPKETDLTVRLIRALVLASAAEPALNAWFDEVHQARKCMPCINLGLAIDSEAGLFVPVINDVARLTDASLRKTIESYKQAVRERSLPKEQLQGATFTLSNFGKFAGRFANPVIVPPTVAILGVGRRYDAVVPHQKKMVIHPILPLSLTFDHRAITGGEASRFLQVLMENLYQAQS